MSTAKKKILYKKLKEHNTIWHPESTLVFKSQRERLVIGRYVDGEIIQLDDKAIDLCDDFNFTPDESLFESISGEDTNPSSPIGDNKDNSEEEVEENDEQEVEQEVEQEDEQEDEEDEEDEERQEQEEEDELEDKAVDKENESVVEDKAVDEVERGDKENESVVEDTFLSVKKQNETPIKSGGECFPIIDMCSNLLAEVTQRESQLKNFLSAIQENLDNERHKGFELSEELSQTKNELSQTKDELSELQEKYSFIKQKFDTMKSLFS